MEFKRDPRFGRMIPAMVTPFNADLELDLYRAQELADRLVRGGADALIVNGTTGESPTVFYPQKLELFRAVVRAVNGRIPVIANVGDNCTADTVYFAQDAAKQGVDGFMCVVPYYNKPPQEGLYRHFKTIADSTDMPIILYNIPARTGNKLLPETVQALCRDVENIVGAKDSSGDIENLKAYIRLTRELDKEVAILAGNDGAILTCLKEGGAGGIAGRANIWPETVAKIYDCFKAGDLEGAQAAQDAIAILQQTFKYGNPNTIIKTAVALQGHPVGKCRAPFNYVPEEGMEAIKKVLAENEAKGLH